MQPVQDAFHSHLFSFVEGSLDLHENLMTCVIAAKRPVVVSNDADHLEAQVLCIRPGVPHRVFVDKGGAEIMYFDGVRLPPAQSNFMMLSDHWCDVPRAFETCDSDRIVAFRAALQGATQPPDQTVMRIITRLYSDPFSRMSQDELAQSLRLERTQALRHFKSTTGQTFRKFKIWAGIVAATRNALDGAQIGHAGIEAGFSDAAHLARTAATVFGISPSKGLSGLRRMVTDKGTSWPHQVPD